MSYYLCIFVLFITYVRINKKRAEFDTYGTKAENDNLAVGDLNCKKSENKAVAFATQ
jgi:hypothetical protein